MVKENTDQQQSESYKISGYRRRRVLQSTGVAATVGLAGCSGILGGSDDEDLGEEVETMDFLVPSGLIQDWTRSLANTWEEMLGVSIDQEVVDFATWLDRTFGGEGDFDDMVAYTWTSAPERFSPAFMLEKFTSDALDNIMGYENPEFDDLYDEYLETFEEDEQNEILEEMQEIVLEDVPVIELFRQPEINAVNTAKWDMDETPLLGMGNAALHTHMTAEPNESEFDGDTSLSVATENRWTRPNPLNVTGGTTSARMGLIFDTLRIFNTDGEFMNWAADSIEAIDSTTLEVTIRDDMTFHDGEDVTAEDVAFSMEMFADPDLPWPKYSGLAENIDSATAETDLTLTIDFDPPDSTFLQAGALYLRIVPEHVWGDIIAEEDDPVNLNMSADEIVGSGPFEAVEFSDERVRFEAVDDHWSGLPAYDAQQTIPFDGSEALRASVAEGQTYLFDQSPSIDLAQSAADANDDVELTTGSGLYWAQIGFDNQEGPCSDPAIRKAMFHTTGAADVQDIFFEGNGDIANGTTVHPELEGIGGDFPPITEYFSREQAREILSDAGYGWDSDDNLHHLE